MTARHVASVVVALVALVALSATTACSTTRGQAKEVGAAAIACPVKHVKLVSHGAAEYTVIGCGNEVDVDCQPPATLDRSQHPDGHTYCVARKPK